MININIISVFISIVLSTNALGCLNKLACSIILPASTFERPPILTEADIKKSYNLGPEWNIKPKMIETTSKKSLDTILIIPPGFDAKIKQSVIIVFNPNAAFWQDMLPDMLKWAKDLDSMVIGFNYRGLGYSTSYPNRSQDLVKDGITVVEYVKKQTAASMVLYGRSLGGSIASYVANHMHKQGLKPKLFVDRSFRKLSLASNHIIAKAQQQGREMETWQGSLFALAPIQTLAKIGLVLSRWSLNTEKEFKSIPKERRMAIYASHDEMFPFKQSLCSALPKEEQQWLFLGGHNQSMDSLKHHKIRGLNGTNLFYNFVLNY
ncbi:MAG: hypothetical protein AB8G05_11660 [Oligoflexales bacterium]